MPGRNGYPGRPNVLAPSGHRQPPNGHRQPPNGHRQPPSGHRRPGQVPPAPGRKPRRQRLIDYPRYDRDRWTRWIPSWKLNTSITALLVIAAMATALVAYALTPLPEVKRVTDAQTTTVYYSDGKTVLTRFLKQNRTIVPLSRVPAHVQEAVISAEDRTFYQNNGVSPIGIVRAAWSDARGGALQGGSTITQQYVKNTTGETARTWQRKVKEFFSSIKIANELPKEKILETYLNTIYFGRGAYGIQAAAHAWFDKDVDKLTVPEGAFLAGIVNGPELYDPDDDPTNGGASTARAQARFDYVLDGMVLLKYLTPADRAKITIIPKPKKLVAVTTKQDDQTIYLTEMVRAELESNGYPRDMVDSAGWKIYTTFDKKMMGDAVASVQKTLGPRATWDKWDKKGAGKTQIGLVSIDPASGAVKAIYGGDGKSYSEATGAQSPAGSTFKPFALLAAIEGPGKNGEDGISLKSRFDGDSPYTTKGGDKITNFGNADLGMIDLVHATEDSVNSVFMGLNEKIGPERTEEAAIRAGIPKPQSTPRGPGTPGLGPEVTNVLGNASVHVKDMASAYATIASGGMYAKPYVISSIKTADGGTVFTQGPAPTRVFNDKVVDDVTYAMQQVIKGAAGTAQYARKLGRPAAGKTGTVAGPAGTRTTKAAWFIGFTPQLSTAVVLHRDLVVGGGQADVIGWGKYAGKNMQGGWFPAEVWTVFMKLALKGKPVMPLPKPAYVGEALNPAPEPVDTADPALTDVPAAGQGGDPNAPTTSANPGQPSQSPSDGASAATFPSDIAPGGGQDGNQSGNQSGNQDGNQGSSNGPTP